jgi:hypothetical protein
MHGSMNIKPIKILCSLSYIQNSFRPILCILAIDLLLFCNRISYLFLYRTSRCVCYWTKRQQNSILFPVNTTLCYLISFTLMYTCYCHSTLFRLPLQNCMLPYSKVCSGDLKMVEWPKHVVVRLKNIKIIYCVLTSNKILFCFLVE